MKKALTLFLMFFMFLIAGTILGTIFYSLYLSSLNLVVGKESVLFSKENLMTAFFLTGEILAFLTGFILISYRIRHHGGFLQLIAFIITQVISWTILFPSLFYFEDLYVAKYQVSQKSDVEEQPLSKGFFRVSGNNVYYFIDDLKPSYKRTENGARAIKINTSENGTVDIFEVKYPSMLNIVANASPYKDIIVKKTFESKKTTVLSFFYKVTELARDNFHKGKTFWLSFISLGFALACVYAISAISDWRLINFSIAAVLTAGILYWNYIYTTPALEEFRSLSIANINIGSLNKYVDNTFLVLTNLLIGIVLILIGIINFIIRKQRSN